MNEKKSDILVLSRSELKKIVSEILFEREKEQYYNRMFTVQETMKLLNISRWQLRTLVKKGILKSPMKGRILGLSIYSYIKEIEKNI